MEAQCKERVKANGVASLIVTAGERRGLLREGFENMMRSRNEGPSRDWAWWRLDGWGAGRAKRKEGEWGETIETNWSRDGRLKSDNLRRCCWLQDRGAVQGWSVRR